MKIKMTILDGKPVGFAAYADDYEFFSLKEDEIEVTDQTLIKPFEPKSLKVVDGAIVRMSEEEKAAVDAIEASKIINIEKTKRELYHAFKNNIDLYLAIYSPIADFLTYRNFTDLKDYATRLITGGKVSAEIYDAFNSILLSNNINLAEY